MPKLQKTALAVAGAALGAVIAFPPSRRRLVRGARSTMDELLMRTDTPWSRDLVLLTTEGHDSRLPRTTVLSGVRVDGELYVLPWDRDAHWFQNLRRNSDVVVDDRTSVRRAHAEVVEGEVADRVRRMFIERNVPGPLRGVVQRPGSPIGQGLPAVRLVPGR